MKKKVLIFSQFFYPGYRAGGPIKSITNLTKSLSDKFTFNIVCSSRDDGVKKNYKNIKLDQINDWGSNFIYYVSENFFKIFKSLKLIRSDCDIIYLQSFFSLKFSIIVIMYIYFKNVQKSIIIAPRGEFNKNALELKKIKKSIYLAFFKTLGLHKKIIFHSTNEYETLDINNLFGNKVKVFEVKNIGDKPSLIMKNRSKKINENVFKIVFLSRIAKMKNLDFAIQSLRKINKNIIFDIWGPISDKDYWLKCQDIIKNLPENIIIDYKGVAKQKNVPSILSKYDLLFLPSLGENFGHVISESFSVGTPVLISDNTPWKNLEINGLGWDLPLTNNNVFKDTILRAHDLYKKNPVLWRRRVIDYAEKNFNYDEEVKLYMKYFNYYIN